MTDTRTEVARLEGEKAALAAALRTAQAAFAACKEREPGSWWDTVAWMRREVDTALSGEGKVWEQVRDKIERALQTRGAPATDLLRAALAAMKGERDPRDPRDPNP